MSQDTVKKPSTNEQLAIDLTHAAIACVLDNNNWDRALPLLHQVTMVVSAEKTPFSVEVALALDELGTLCYGAGRLTEARHFLQRSVQIKELSQTCKSHPSLAGTLSVLAAVLRKDSAASEEAKTREAQAAKIMEDFFAIKSNAGK